MKTLVIYGDSISTNNFGNGSYTRLLKQKLAADRAINHAVNGTGITRGTLGSLAEQLESKPELLHSDADIIVLWHGSNDWYWGARVGTPEAAEKGTYCGDIEFCVEKIRSASPGAYIVLPTPLFRYQAPEDMTEVKEAFYYKNKNGYTMKDYYDAVIAMATKLSCATADTRKGSNINLHNAPELLPDNIHPSEKGYERITDIIAATVNTVIPVSREN